MTDRRAAVEPRDYFDGLAKGWSDRYSSDPSFAERPRWFSDAIADLAPGAEVLDFGCGTGEISCHLHDLGHRVTGLDSSEEMITACQRRQRRAGLQFVHYDGAVPLPFETASFDVVVASSVLEYVTTIEPLLEEFQRILRPGGRLVATVPDPRDPQRKRETWIRRLLTFPGLSPLVLRSRWAEGARYLGLSVNRFPPSAWLAMLAKTGFDHDSEPAECCGPHFMLRGWMRR